MIEDPAEKQAKALPTLNADQQFKSSSGLFSKDFLTVKARDKLNKTKKREQEINRDHLIYKTGNKKKTGKKKKTYKTYNFQKLKTIRSFVKRNL